MNNNTIGSSLSISELKQIFDNLKPKRKTLVIPDGTKPRFLQMFGVDCEKTLRDTYGIRLSDTLSADSDVMYEIDEEKIEAQIKKNNSFQRLI